MSLQVFDRLAEQSRDGVLLAARVLLALIFVISGFGKLTGFEGFVATLAAKGLPLPTLWAIPAVAAEFFGSVCILLGLRVRPVALVMFVFTGFTAFIAHRFWSADAASYQIQWIQFMKNLAIMGGFLAGPGAVSIDGRGRR